MLKSKEKEGVEGKEKLPNVMFDPFAQQQNKPMKISEESKRELDKSGVHVSSSIIRQRLLEKGRKARKPK